MDTDTEDLDMDTEDMDMDTEDMDTNTGDMDSNTEGSNTDTEDSEQAGTQFPLNPLASAVDVDHSIEPCGGLHPPPLSASEVPHELRKGAKSKADDLNDKLAAHEQMYREIMKALEREEGRLNERRKKAGGSIVKSKKLVQDTFELNALKQFNNLRIEYHRKKAKNPNLKLCPSLEASTTIARRLGKSNYYARRLRERSTYLHRVGELQTSKQGKGAAHQSLLSEPQVVAAIQAWVKGTVPVEKGGYIGRVWCFE